MERIVVVFLLVFFMLSACDWQIPDAIEIKGNPSLAFSIDMDLSDHFVEILDTAFGLDENSNILKLDCVNVFDIKTFLIRMELFNGTLDSGRLPSPIDNEIIVNDSIPLEDSVTTLPLTNFGNLLKGFRFHDAYTEAYIFIDASDIIDDLKIKIDYGTGNKIIEGASSPKNSGINTNTSVYNETVCPESDKPFDEITPFLIKHQDLDIILEIFLEPGTYSVDLFDNLFVMVELIIWLPLVFEPEDDEAEIVLPGFSEFGGFFKTLSESGLIENIDISIELNDNPFKEGELVIRDTYNKYLISAPPMTDKNLKFSLNEDDIIYIGENSFEPEFCFLFDKGEILKIPKNLRAITIGIEAAINKRIELSGGDE